MLPVLVAALLAAAPPSDSVYTVDGGRITGTVLEESPTAGVTIQLPDGSVQRLDRNQVQRIEFADGTVSTVRPAVPPPAAAAPVPASARAPIVDGPIDTAYFKGSGRVRGTVMEESASTGVKVRLIDGSIHTYPADEIARIEYADGTVSTPQPVPAKLEVPAPRARPAEPVKAPIDNVYFLGGGRVRGTVIEENPKTGVKVRLLDGSVETFSRDDLVRIEYADGSVSRRVTQPAVAAVPPLAVAPPPAAPAQPVPPPAPVKQEKPQAFPLYLSAGIGVSFLGGDAQQGTRLSTVMTTQQAHLSGEAGLRLSPSFVLGVYGDVGASDPASSVRASCNAAMMNCTAETTHYGFLVRHTWNPLSRRPTWLSLGTGWETGGVVVDNHGSGSNSQSDLFKYKGREFVRVGAGVDFRSNEIIGLGLYGSLSFGEYDHFKDQTGVTSSIQTATHTTGQVGLRLILFP
jgi:hypothetical protein